MKIAFVGDSYCAEDTPDGSYLDTITTYYSAELACKGLQGRALFHSYEVLLTVVDEADYIMLYITEPYRLPNRYGIDITPYTRWTAKSTILNKRVQATLERAVSDYYTSIISFKWHKVAHKGLLMQIDELMIQKQKKCIWFPCFPSSMQGFTPKSGPITTPALQQFAELMPKHIIWNRNHLSRENNENMANLIINIINSDDFTPRVIALEGRFEVV